MKKQKMRRKVKERRNSVKMGKLHVKERESKRFERAEKANSFFFRKNEKKKRRFFFLF